MTSKTCTLLFLILLPLVSQAQLDFGPAVYVQGMGTPLEMVVGDFNGDGKQDVFISSEPRSLTSVMYSNGDETFTRKDFRFTSGTALTSTVSVGDFNKDNKDDVVVIDQLFFNPGSKMIVGISTGTDFTQKLIDIETSGGGSRAEIYDFDGDGNKDILLAYSGLALQFYKGDGAGNFTKSIIGTVLPALAGTFLFKVADINADQKPDLVFLSDNLLTTFTTGTGTSYVKKEVALTGAPGNVMLADFSGDGIPDVVSLANTAVNGLLQVKLKYFVNDGHGVFAVPIDVPTRTQPYRGLDHADYDGDGREDILTGAYLEGSAVNLLHNVGNNTFEDKLPDKPLAGGLTGTNFVNIDGAGKPEILTTSVYKTLEIYKYNGTTYVPSSEVITGAGCQFGEIYDLDGDGIKDIVGASTTNGAAAVWYGKGDLKYEDPIYYKAIKQMQSIAVADFNADGFGDIVYGAYSFSVGGGGTTSVLLSTGARSYAPPKMLYNGGTSVLTTADLNNDDKPDIITAYNAMINDGDGNFTLNILNVNANSTSVATIDYNNDDFLDVVMCIGTSISIGLNDGAGNFNTFNEVTLTGPIYAIRAVDLNGDEHTDIVGVAGVGPNANTPDIILLTSTGASQFTEAHITPTPNTSYTTSITVADFDKDGLNDLVTNFGSGELGGMAVYLAKPTGGYQNTISFESKSATEGQLILAGNTVLADDIDGDGRTDVILLSLNGPPVAIIPNEFVSEPTNAPAAISAVATDVTATISVTKGNGTGRLVMIRKDPGTTGTPADGTFYTANATFGLGAKIATDNSVVMTSNEPSTTVTGLTSGTTYIATAFEFVANTKNTLVNYLSTPVTTTFTTLKTQTITFDAVTPKAIGAGTFAINATSSASLPITLSLISATGVLTNNIFTPTVAGTVKIKASQAGNAEYAPASADLTFCVLPAKPTITIANPAPGKFTLTSSSDANNNWFRDGTAVAVGTAKTFEPTEDGIYKVTVKIDGCENSSDPTANLITAVIDEWTNSFSVYPNPASSSVTITHPQNFNMTEDPILFNSVGSAFRLKTKTTTDGIEMNTEDLHPGLYIIRLQGQKPVTLKMVKR